eukprot:3524200-Prymnesium_polylepis.1
MKRRTKLVCVGTSSTQPVRTERCASSTLAQKSAAQRHVAQLGTCLEARALIGRVHDTASRSRAGATRTILRFEVCVEEARGSHERVYLALEQPAAGAQRECQEEHERAHRPDSHQDVGDHQDLVCTRRLRSASRETRGGSNASRWR